MRALILAILAIFLSSTSCSSIDVKLKPDYIGVDLRARKIYNEFIWLSTQNNIVFKKSVTVGFKVIKSDTVIGVCNRSPFFREVDLDSNYWMNTSSTSQTALLYHELAHCYCGRDHDYAEGLDYPSSAVERLYRALEWKAKGGPRPGYWDDGCPTSLMYPVIVDDDCTLKHYSEYTKEMFDRCQAW